MVVKTGGKAVVPKAAFPGLLGQKCTVVLCSKMLENKYLRHVFDSINVRSRLNAVGVKYHADLFGVVSIVLLCLSGCQLLERGGQRDRAGQQMQEVEWAAKADGAAVVQQVSASLPMQEKVGYRHIDAKNISMSDAVGIAIARHPDIGRATAVTVQSNAQIAVEKSAWYPTLQYGVEPGYSRYYGSRRLNSGSDSIVRGTVGANQLVYDFGRTSSRIGAARATHERDEFLLKNAVESIAGNMAEIYIELATAQALVNAAGREHMAMRQTREKIAERLQNGLSDAVDLNQADIAIRQAHSDVLFARMRYNMAAGRFAEIIGIRPERVYSLGATMRFVESLGSGGRNSVDSTPRVLAAEAEIKAALERVRLARAQFYPSVDLNLNQQKATGQRNATNDSSFIGLRMVGALNTGLREKHQIAAAKAELDVARQSSESERLAVRTTFRSAATEAQSATERISNARQIMALSLTSRDLLWQQYIFNKRPLTDVVSAERDTFMAESSHINAVADYLNARVKAWSVGGELVERLRNSNKTMEISNGR